MANIFLGEPSARIRKWILDHRQSSLGFWDQMVKNLETEPQQEKKIITSIDELVDGVLPSVGSTIPVDYKIDPNGEAVSTEWMILGYNKDIPRFVKYKDEAGNRVYMDVLPGTSLLATFDGANVYSNKDGSGNVLGTVSAPGGTTFTYGNNNTYSVPETITVNGTIYTFCGYNVTLQSKYGLVVKFDDSLYKYSTFDSQDRNDWKTSDMRKWLNGMEAISTQTWFSNSGVITGTIVGFLGRLSDTTFAGNIIPTVTRMWVYADLRDETKDSNGCYHLADKFRLLGVGEVNCKGAETTNHFPDGGARVDGENKGYDTSRFSEIFNETDIWVSEESRKRYFMKEDGTEGSACGWWLRSAYYDNTTGVGSVGSDGMVIGDGGASDAAGILPVCLIG